MIKEKEVKQNQNIIDACIHHYGGVEGLIQLLEDNPSLNPDSVLTVGSKLNVEQDKVVNKKVLNYYNVNNLVPATGAELPDADKDYWVTSGGSYVVDDQGNRITVNV